MPSQPLLQSANPLVQELHARLQATDLLGQHVVAAVSGGTDSLALLLGLSEINQAGLIAVQVAHFDHLLRTESKEDARYVLQVASKLGLPISLGSADVEEIARVERRGIEETARRERYRFLGEVCQAVGAAAVVTGHTADDQVETRLLHVVRGSGLHGLTGMADDVRLAWPGVAPVRVVRPLLKVTRAATEAFCRERGMTPREDPSNTDRRFSRNRLRHEVVPSLTTLNPRLAESLDRLGQIASDAEDFVEAELDRRLSTVVSVVAGDWLIDRAAWRELHPALKRALLRRAAAEISPYAAPLTAGHVEEAMAAADAAPAGTRLAWPDQRELRIWHDRLVIAPSTEEVAPLAEQAVPIAHMLTIPLGPVASVLLEGTATPEMSRGGLLTATFRHTDQRCASSASDRWHVDFDLARLDSSAPLVIRTRRPGDRLAPVGMNGTKKVQDLLVDAHVPREQRDWVPILAGTSGPIWVIGLRPDRRFLATENCREVLCATVGLARPHDHHFAEELVRCTT